MLSSVISTEANPLLVPTESPLAKVVRRPIHISAASEATDAPDITHLKYRSVLVEAPCFRIKPDPDCVHPGTIGVQVLLLALRSNVIPHPLNRWPTGMMSVSTGSSDPAPRST